MTRAIDQNQDKGKKELYTYLTGTTIPEFVKNASFEDVQLPRASVGLAKYAFADEAGYFPINSKARTFVSAVYFLNKHAELAKTKGKEFVSLVADNLQKAAAVFGIEKEISNYGIEMITKKASKEKVAQTIDVSVDGDTIELFKIASAEDLVSKAQDFSIRMNDYPFCWRRDIANRFVKIAEYFAVDELPTLVLKYAGHYYPNLAEVESILKVRASRAPEKVKKAYTELMTDIPNMGTKEDFFKLAEVCDYLEGTIENRTKRANYTDAVDALFTLTLDKVAEMLDVIKIGGKQYELTELEKVSSDIYEQAFGFEKPASLDEMRAILPTVPLSDFALFRQLSKIQSI